MWSADGKSLLFNEVHGTDTNLYRLDIASDTLVALTSEVGTLRALAYSQDRSAIAYSFNDFDTPADLYASALDGSGAIRLTHANPWIEEEILLPKSRILQWQSSDGTTIEGIFMLPSDYREGAQVPLVLQIHGGPSGYWANAFEPDLIVYAGLGYAVLGPNVRGSSGYGDDLLRGLMGDVGGGEYQDLMSGVDHVIDAGYIDPEKTGVAGWSWGGVLAGWVITQTDRFKAASVGAGVSNWIRGKRPGLQLGHLPSARRWKALDQPRRVAPPLGDQLRGERPRQPCSCMGTRTNEQYQSTSMVYAFDARQERAHPRPHSQVPSAGARNPRATTPQGPHRRRD